MPSVEISPPTPDLSLAIMATLDSTVKSLFQRAIEGPGSPLPEMETLLQEFDEMYARLEASSGAPTRTADTQMALEQVREHADAISDRDVSDFMKAEINAKERLIPFLNATFTFAEELKAHKDLPNAVEARV